MEQIQKFQFQLLKQECSLESWIGFVRIHFNIRAATYDWTEMEKVGRMSFVWRLFVVLVLLKSSTLDAKQVQPFKKKCE